jgi:hypothetical protein
VAPPTRPAGWRSTATVLKDVLIGAALGAAVTLIVSRLAVQCLGDHAYSEAQQLAAGGAANVLLSWLHARLRGHALAAGYLTTATICLVLATCLAVL